MCVCVCVCVCACVWVWVFDLLMLSLRRLDAGVAVSKWFHLSDTELGGSRFESSFKYFLNPFLLCSVNFTH